MVQEKGMQELNERLTQIESLLILQLLRDGAKSSGKSITACRS